MGAVTVAVRDRLGSLWCTVCVCAVSRQRIVGSCASAINRTVVIAGLFCVFFFALWEAVADL